MGQHNQEILEVLLDSAAAALKRAPFEQTARKIFDACKAMTGATAGYVALLSPHGSENEVLFLDDGGLPCTVDPDMPMPIRGLRAEAYKTGQAVYDNDFANSEWVKFMPGGHVALRNVMFSPLNVDGATVGLIGLANKDGGFTDEDARAATGFGCFAALALQQSATQQALTRSEQQFGDLLQSINDVVWSTDTDGRLDFVNKAAADLYGASLEEFRKNPLLWLESVHPEDRPVMERKARELLEGRNFVCEYRIVRPDNSIRWVQDRSTPVCDENGTLVRIAGITTDITLRKEAEFSLYRELSVNAALAALGRELVDPDTSIEQVAQSVLTHARSLTQSRHGFVSEVDPRTRTNISHTLTSMMRDECRVSGANRKIEFPCNPDGAYPSLWGHGLNLRQSFFTNRPAEHPHSSGVPAGHVPIKNFLNVPVVSGGELLGQIALANSSRDYTESDVYVIERLATIYAMAVQRQRQRRALELSETRFRALVEQAGDSIFLVDWNNRIQDVNDQACTSLGYTREQLLSMGVDDIDPHIDSEKLKQLYANARPGQIRKFESEHQRSDGTLFPVELTTTVIDIHGELHRMTIARDISERRRYESDRDRLEQRLRSLWRVARLVDADLKTVCDATLTELVSITGSRYGFYGFIDSQTGNMEVHSWSPDTMADCAVDSPSICFPINEGGIWSQAVSQRRPMIFNRFDDTVPGRGGFPEGHVNIERLLLVPVVANDAVVALAAVANKQEDYTSDDMEQVRAFAANVQIVIDKKRTEEEMDSLREQLIQSQKMEAIGRLAGGMAHDFNNMLAVILGNASLALADASPGDPAYEELGEIVSAAERSRELTLKLLTFARKDKLNQRTVSPVDLLDDLLSMLRRSISKTVVIHSDYHHELPFVTVDITQIQQALLNVCTNACDAMPGSGVFYVGAHPRRLSQDEITGLAPGYYCEISIADTGTGVPESIAGKIFDPFYTTKGTGLGLGLSLTHGILSSHGGAVLLDRERKPGARFVILLPASEHMLQPETPIDHGFANAVPRGSETVLIVDDEPAVLALAARILGRAGYHVITASNGSDAVEILRRAPRAVDAIVLDLIMPGMTGEEVFHILHRKHPHIPIILASGYSREGVAENLLQAGAAAFTQKPFSMQDLCRTVRHACDTAR